MSVEAVSSKPTPQVELYQYYTSEDKKPLSSLSTEELEIVSKAIKKVLKSPAAEACIPNLIDGPGFEQYDQGWPVSLEKPPPASKPSITRYSKAVEALDLSSLEVNSKVLEEFQSAPDSTPYKEHRLLEIICAAIHYIAIDQYKTNFPPPEAQETLKDFLPPAYPVIAHSQYYASKPWKGIFDYKAVGFWAEAQIFGGVVYFDRGYKANSSDTDYRGIWLHGLPNAYTDSLWRVPDSVVSKALEGVALPFDIEAAKNPEGLMALEEAEEEHLIYRDPHLANKDAYTGEHGDEVTGLSDEDLAEIQALKKNPT